MHKHGAAPWADSERRSSRLLLTLGLVVLLSGLQAGHAQQAAPELPTEPILRIEAGLHGQFIQRVDVDAANKFAVTASSDKTVRVWSLPDGRPQGVLRLPIDYGRIGEAFAVAISPDGTTIAAGGWTGPANHQNIFLFDRVSGALKQRLPDLPSTVDHLAYSADGQRLAASLYAGGIRVFDASKGYGLLPSDSAYGGVSHWAHFDRAGRLVTAAYDGVVRLYAAGQYATPVVRFEWKGHRPWSAVFSADGARVAVADSDTPDVVVLSGSDLTQLFLADTSGIPRDANLSSVAWSQDGSFLFAGGTWTANTLIQVRRWSYGSGPKAYVDIPLGSGGVRLVALKSGSILAAGDSGLALVAADAKVTQLQGLGRLDLRSVRGRELRVSADGSTVQVDSWQPRHSYGFALADRRVQIDPIPVNAANCLYVFCREALQEPIRQAPGLDITNWANWFASKKPAVNGTPLKLSADERSLSVAIVPGAQHFVLGADFSLHLFDQQGHDVWLSEPQVPLLAWHVNVTANGRLVVAAYGDGTIRWHRLSDGKELLALFIHPDGQRWVAWTPQGYYDASLGADELIGWHINHGYDRVPDFYPIAQFRDRFYRPDVIQRVLQTPSLDVEEAVRDADRATQRPATKAPAVSSLLTPVVKIHSADPAAVDRTDMQLAYSVQMPSAGDPLRVEALIDGVKTTAVDHSLVATGEARAGMLNLTIPRRNSVVSILAYNGEGAGEPASIHVQWRGPGTDPKLTLYVLAIGVGKYRDKNVKPLLAGKDADDFVALVKTQAGGLYEKVITHPPNGSLRDAAATKEAILDELDWIRSAVTNTNNVAMVFLSGHGVMTPDQHYRFLPHDYDPQHVERTTISDYELADYLTKIGGKKLFFFDTCHSGAVLGGKAPDTAPNVDKFANELKAAENGVVVFTSSTGTELSQEGDNNSVFTQAVVEGLGGKAGRPEVPVITINDLNGYVSRRVKELTNGNQKPMMAMPKTVEDFPISVRIR